jgi:hypothetical protein
MEKGKMNSALFILFRFIPGESWLQKNALSAVRIIRQRP